ncbi:hypothetical protein STSP2_02946 [Anaerohalosphaera lusitana]|uniref:Uncharacterized protein n=1 Tax=Anaerohalosphaera lusitana TaxID=1936003 RepID=A0A1U9NPB5_9BACT|nr:hypothetical protein [Anaerohalosphaera lusitana]AQT69749.1 hypothetical protein STSP2_02946 [Anaerohalosphaera lusitana]
MRKNQIWLTMAALLTLTPAIFAELVTHTEFQAVKSDGTSDFTGPETVTLEGIVLNSPEQLWDVSASAPAYMGGQWEMYIQGRGTDHAGTAVWLGQKYGNLGWVPPTGSYSDSEWLAELWRVNHDPNTAYTFQPGDLVRVTGKHLFYNGKRNINEQHDNDPAKDFTVELIQPAVGMPQPEPVSLNELKDASDDFIFDPTRQTGCEYYQGRYIRINDVSFAPDQTWGQGQTVTITDNHGRTFPVLLGRGPGIRPDSNNLADVFDVIGIMDQSCQAPHTAGYQLIVCNYDGNGLVLGDRGFRRGTLRSDANMDAQINLKDLAILANEWLEQVDGLVWTE